MNPIICLVCHGPIDIKISETRKSQKPCINMRCERDGRHFRAFITDREFVENMMAEASPDKA
jgi:hypothetical protein